MTYFELFGGDFIDLDLKEHKESAEIAILELERMAKKYNVATESGKISYILGAVESVCCISLYELNERCLEMINLFVTLHLHNPIIVGGVRCCSCDEELKTVILDYLLNKFSEEMTFVPELYNCAHGLSMEEIVCKVKCNNKNFINCMLEEATRFVELDLKEKKKRKQTLIQVMCQLLHPDYLEYKKLCLKTKFVLFMMYLCLQDCRRTMG